MAQWLRFPPSNAGGPGLISGQGARCHMPLNYDLAQPNKFLKMKQKRPGKFLPVEVMYETSGKAFGPGSSLLFLLSGVCHHLGIGEGEKEELQKRCKVLDKPNE